MLYCIEIQREFADDNLVLHHEFDTPPTEADVLKYLGDEDIAFDPDYGRLKFYPGPIEI